MQRMGRFDMLEIDVFSVLGIQVAMFKFAHILAYIFRVSSIFQ